MARYATTTDLARLGLPSAALVNVSTAAQEAALDAASALAEGYFPIASTALPLTSWGEDLRRAVCAIASYDLMTTRGYMPSAGQDETLRLRFEDAMKWLRDVSAGRVVLFRLVDATPSDTSDNEMSTAITSASRGWRR